MASYPNNLNLLYFSFNWNQLFLIVSDLHVVVITVCYLTIHSVFRLCCINDRMINEYGAVGIMEIGRGNQSTQEKTYPRTSLSTTNPA
jgi:hypothetical protein